MVSEHEVAAVKRAVRQLLLPNPQDARGQFDKHVMDVSFRYGEKHGRKCLKNGVDFYFHPIFFPGITKPYHVVVYGSPLQIKFLFSDQKGEKA